MSIKFASAPQAVSLPLASADGAIRFIDRCQIAWCGPEGQDNMPLYHPIHEYASEAWYRKLFTGPEGRRPKVGNNDPACQWSANSAAAVRRTVAFIESEVMRRVLGRLALTGRMLLVRSAAGLWPRLQRKLEEEVAGGGGDARLGDALEAAFEVLDTEVRAQIKSHGTRFLVFKLQT
eukprot:tig00000339_g24182.t1